MPYSNNEKLVDYDITGGSNVQGRFYYDVTGNVMRHGGCTNDTNLGMYTNLEQMNIYF